MAQHVPLVGSLTAKILLWMMSLFLAVVWGLTLGASHFLRADMERLLGEQQQATVHLVANQIVASFQERADALAQVAQEINAQHIGRPQTLQAVLEKHTILQLMFNAGTFVVNGDGVGIGEVPKIGRIGLNYKDRDHVALALEKGVPVVGRPVIGKTVKAPSFALTQPIYGKDGQVIGALVGAIDLSRPNFLDSVINSHYGKSGGYQIVDPRHRLFVTATADNRDLVMQPIPKPGANPVLDRRLLGFDGPAVNVNSRGVEVLSASARIPMPGWFVVSTLPAAEAFAPIQSLQQRLTLFALALSLLSLGLTWWLLQRLLAPMQAAAKAVHAIAKGEAQATYLPKPADDEVGQLVEGFNHAMAVALSREQALRVSELHLQTVIGAMSEGLVIQDAQGRIVSANPASERILGLTLDQMRGLSSVDPRWRAVREDETPYPGTDHPAMVALRTGVAVSNAIMGVNDPRAGRRWISVNAVPIFAPGDPAPTSVLATFTDITARKSGQLALEDMNKDFVTLLESSSDFLYFKDRDSRFRYCSQTLANITGHTSWRDMVGKHDLEVFPAETARIYAEEEAAIFSDGTPLLNKVDPYFKADGQRGWVSTNKWPMFDADGKTIVGIFGISRDVTDVKLHEHELEVLATTDFLTGVATRRAFIGDMEYEIARVQREPAVPCAVLMFDLDHFKQVNDTYGHSVGDQVLKHVTQLVRAEIRKVDRIGRLGGEEFAILMPGADAAAARVFAERLRAKVESHPTAVTGAQVAVTISLGLTDLRSADLTPTMALERVDLALYRAKHNGRNRVETAQ